MSENRRDEQDGRDGRTTPLDDVAGVGEPPADVVADDTAAKMSDADDSGATDDAVRREINSRSRRSFLALGVAAAGGFAGWKWLTSRPGADGIPYPLRRAHEFNEKLTAAYFDDARLAPTFARSLAREPRVNGGEGMNGEFDPAMWRLQVLGLANPKMYTQYVEDVAYEIAVGDQEAGEEPAAESDAGNSKDVGGAGDAGENMNDRTAEGEAEAEPGLLLTMEDIKRLPRVEMTTELKCIEGWSEIVHWAGARLADFAALYQPMTRDGSSPDLRNRPQDLVRYVGLETPDSEYYVGMDMPSALHPQTLLCYEMNGEPLSMQHGAPLRLVTPVKYGIKHIKRIGRITFTDERPDDFWAERGYDWYSGH